MSLPIINYKHKNTEASHKYQALLENKLSSLQRYFENETDLKMEVEFEKLQSHSSGNIFRLEANIWLVGKLYRAEATEESFEKAIDEVRSELDKEMRRSHKKKESLFRKGGRAIKEMMRRS